MGRPSLPDPSGPAHLYTGRGAHLAVLEAQAARPRGCLACRQPFQIGAGAAPPPVCERCGLAVGHFDCYVATVALAPLEQDFFTSDDPEALDARGLAAIFLCTGCRS